MKEQSHAKEIEENEDFYSLAGLVRLYNEHSGEKAKMIAKKMDLAVEIADSFSWLCAILVKLSYIYDGMDNFPKKGAKRSFSSTIALEYQNPYKSNSLFCPKCRKVKCICQFVTVKNENLKIMGTI